MWCRRPSTRRVTDPAGSTRSVGADAVVGVGAASTSLWAIASPAAREPGPAAFRKYGHSKDHRNDLPQIVGLAVTKEGIPVRVWCWPGNSNDAAILPQVRDDIRGWRPGRVITVVDRGFSSADNLAYLRRGGGHFIAGMRMRNGNPLTDTVLSRQGRYQQVRDNLRVKEVAVDDTDVRYIVCSTPNRPNATAPSARTPSPACRPSWPGSPPPAPRPATRRPASPNPKPRPRTPRPSARCVIAPRSVAGYVSRPTGAL
jgi:hypothetical protein